MKILFLISSLGAGGAERVAVTLCNAWAKRGDRVVLMPTFSGGGKPFYEISSEVELVYLSDLIIGRKKNLSTYIERFFSLRKTIIQIRPDIIISFLPNVNVAAILASCFLNVPVVCCERSDPTVQELPFFWRIICKIVYPHSDAIVVQTKSVAATIKNVYPKLKRIYTIGNPLPAGILARKIKDTSPTTRTILSLGRLSREKQVDKILRAFARISFDHKEWNLHIYGEGPMRLQLENDIAALDMQDRVTLKGLTTNPWDAMELADIFVMTSEFEGFPNALLESMAIGLPCVAFDCPSGPREISLDGKVASLVPLNDEYALERALRQLIVDTNYRQMIGAKARESVIERFTLDRILKQWDRLFVEIVL